MEDKLKIQNRLAMKVIAGLLESQAGTILGQQQAVERATNQRDALLKQHVQILAYKFMVEYLTPRGFVLGDRQDQIWLTCVDKAVAKLRAKGQKVEDRHIPGLRPTGDLDLVQRDLSELREAVDSKRRPEEFPADVWEAFHKVWTFAVGKSGYDKDLFRWFESDLLRMHREGEGPSRPASQSVRLSVSRVLDRVRHLANLPDKDQIHTAETAGRVEELLSLIGMTFEQFRAIEAADSEKAAG